MRHYIFPIIKKQKEDEQQRGIRIPLYERAPMDIPLPINKDIKDKYIDPSIVDLNIDGNIIEINMKVYSNGTDC